MSGTRLRRARDIVETARSDRPAGTGPVLSARQWLRWLWAQLTSMRTALVLLFALALAAIPGSIVPQQSKSPFKVSDFMKAHPTLGPLSARLDLFDVFGSPWFSAIYLLLFISLIGCIIPRVGTYAKALRARPPATPQRLARLPAYTQTVTDAGADDVLAAADRQLRKARYRVARADESLSAERGYLREAGNLVFHISLLFLLLGVAISTLTGFRGTSIVVVGQTFANTPTQYDDITTGQYFSASQLKPFTIKLDSFTATYETGPVQTGAARTFAATTTVTDRAGDTPHTEQLLVNHPLTVDGLTVHMMEHGYAPTVVVRDGQGNVAFSGPVVFLPQTTNLESSGVINVPDGRPDRLAFEGFFLPTATVGASGPRSLFPDLLNPMLVLNAWYGPPKTETGQTQNVYMLDPAGLTPFQNKSGTDRFRFAMHVGDKVTLPDGRGSITFTGVKPWLRLQLSTSPGLPLSIGAVLTALLGLCLSLFIRPRRLWLRVQPTLTGTSIEVAGLDRADARSGLTDDLDRLLAAARAPGSSPAVAGDASPAPPNSASPPPPTDLEPAPADHSPADHSPGENR